MRYLTDQQSNKETVVGHFLKPSSGSEEKPIHSILYIIAIPIEKVKNGCEDSINSPWRGTINTTTI